MAISKRSPKTPFSRWRGRFHRAHAKRSQDITPSFVFYVTRPTFDKLRLVTKGAEEIETGKAIRDSVEEWYETHEFCETGEKPDWQRFEMALGEISEDDEPKTCFYSEKHEMVMMIASEVDFSREHVLGGPRDLIQVAIR